MSFRELLEKKLQETGEVKPRPVIRKPKVVQPKTEIEIPTPTGSVDFKNQDIARGIGRLAEINIRHWGETKGQTKQRVQKTLRDPRKFRRFMKNLLEYLES